MNARARSSFTRARDDHVDDDHVDDDHVDDDDASTRPVAPHRRPRAPASSSPRRRRERARESDWRRGRVVRVDDDDDDDARDARDANERVVARVVTLFDVARCSNDEDARDRGPRG